MVASRYIDIHTHSDNSNTADILSIRSFRLSEYEALRGIDPQPFKPEKNREASLYAPCESALYSVGIYPFDVEEAEDKELQKIQEIGESLFAIGEIGLDYRPEFRHFSEKQRAIFASQIEIANRLRKPIIIHQVRALDDTLRLLQSGDVPAIFHGFSGSSESARRIVGKGFFISFGALLLRNRRTQEALQSTPLDQIFFETDESTHSIEEIYRFASKLLSIPLEQLKLEITKNFNRLLHYGVAIED